MLALSLQRFTDRPTGDPLEATLIQQPSSTLKCDTPIERRFHATGARYQRRPLPWSGKTHFSPSGTNVSP